MSSRLLLELCGLVLASTPCLSTGSSFSYDHTPPGSVLGADLPLSFEEIIPVVVSRGPVVLESLELSKH